MMLHSTLRPLIDILLAEDNPGDARLTYEALREAQLSHRLQLVTDGETALAYLRREGRYAQAVRPDLVLLDLHLPRKNGWEVVAEMRTRRSTACTAGRNPWPGYRRKRPPSSPDTTRSSVHWPSRSTASNFVRWPEPSNVRPSAG